MSLAYAASGIAVMLWGDRLFDIPVWVRISFGLLLTLYGFFRLMRYWKSGNRITVIAYLFLVLSSTAGCREGSSPSDTATTGHIKISVDECFYPLIDAELQVFHNLYKYAVVTPSYVSEQQAFKDLLADSARLIIVSRKLNDGEIKYFESLNLHPKTLKIATDAVAFITHPENPDSVFRLQQLEEIFKTGKIDSAGTGTHFVFDHTGSSTARFIREKFNTELPAFCFAVNNNEEVVNYVAKNKNAIGIIGVNWLSDSDDSTSQAFLQKIRVVRIMSGNADVKGKQPYQAYIADSSYPLTRDIYIISREARSGLGSGFTAFAASDKGQRIVLKSGLVPATMPVRIIGFKD